MEKKILSEYSKKYIKITTKWNLTKARDLKYYRKCKTLSRDLEERQDRVEKYLK